MMRRILSLMLSAVMVISMLPVSAFAATGCANHPAHGDCSYRDAVAEQTCDHTAHDESCEQEVTACLHTVCDESCTVAGEDGQTTCTHVCSWENGCITMGVVCAHKEDGSCCCIPAQEAVPCDHSCELCNSTAQETCPHGIAVGETCAECEAEKAAAAEKAAQEKAAAEKAARKAKLEADIAALPSQEDVAAMTGEEFDALWDHVAELYDAFVEFEDEGVAGQDTLMDMIAFLQEQEDVSAYETYSGFEYYVNPSSDGKYYASLDYVGSSSSVSVPVSFSASYGGEKVTAYVKHASFYGCSTVTSISFGTNPYLQSYSIYNCENLKTLSLSGTKITRYEGATNCYNLTSVSLPSTVTYLSGDAFAGTSITSYTIPNSVTQIGTPSYGLFANCEKLKSVTIGTGLTELPMYMFKNCTSLSTVTFRSTSKVKTIGQYAFLGCTGLTSLTLPASVTTISEGAFANCSGITTLTLNEGLTSIGEEAFMACPITEITLPKSLRGVTGAAFAGASQLKNIYVAAGSTAFTSVDGVLFDYNKTKLVCYPSAKTATSYQVPKGVKIIGTKAFRGRRTSYSNSTNIYDEGSLSLGKIYIPETVTTIEAKAFSFTNSAGLYFCGNCPDFNYGTSAYTGGIVACYEGRITLYYAEGRSGWPITYKNVNVAIWPPEEHCTKATGNTAAPTCWDGGREEYTCERCGYAYYILNGTPATGAHVFGQYSDYESATCTSDATMIAYCTNEGCSTSDIITSEGTKLGHTYTDQVAKVPATCLETGVEAHYRCSVCEGYFDAEKKETTPEALIIPVDANAHVWTDATGAASGICSACGVHTHSGGVCGGEQGFATPLTQKDLTATYKLEAGSYYLTEDIQLGQTLTLEDSVSLCLNGHTITGSSAAYAITLSSSPATHVFLKLYDCSTVPGKITGGKGIVYAKGTLELYGGILTGSSGNYAVHVPSTYSAYPYYNGSRICMLKMYGGEISGNAHGGVNGSTNSHILISGGAITGNSGGFAVSAGEYGTFEMTGGRISGNTSGGLHIGAVYDVTLSGSAVIKDNTVDGVARNIYLTEEFLTQYASRIDLDGLTSGASLGITTETKPTESAAVAFTGENAVDYSGSFFSDDPDFEISNTETNVLTLVKYVHVHEFTQNVAEEAFLVSPATCQQKAVYYVSCECGETGTKTFEYGDFAAHQIENGLCTLCGKLPVDEDSFPDAVFRDYVSNNFDGDKDGYLSKEEYDKVTSIHVENKGIADLKGVEYFTALETLYCSFNQLKALDVSKNKALVDLRCSDNQLASLNVGVNTALKYLSCDNNQLTELDVTKNMELTVLRCSTNQLTGLDVGNNAKLEWLYCYSNPLNGLNVSSNTALTVLHCASNQLKYLDVSSNTALTDLYCGSNQLTELNVSRNTALDTLYCEDNQLTSLDLSSCTNLTNLKSSGNQYTVTIPGKTLDLTSLPGNFDVAKAGGWVGGTVEGNILTVDSGATEVTYTYDCGNGERAIFQLNIDHSHSFTQRVTEDTFLFSPATCQQKAVYYVSCECGEKGTKTFEYGDFTAHQIENGLCTLCGKLPVDEDNFPDAVFRAYVLENFDTDKDGSLSVDEINNAERITVSGMEITSLKGVERFSALKILICDDNKLTGLDVSKNTALTRLNCNGNQLTALDVTGNTALTSLMCGGNQLKELDVSKNTALTRLNCNGNQLTALDVTGNTALTSLVCSGNQLKELDVSNNTALTDLFCGENQLTALDVSMLTQLTELGCSNNQLKELDVSKNTLLTKLNCGVNQLTMLDVRQNTALTELHCDVNSLKALDVSGNPALTKLTCNSNLLTELDVSQNTALTELSCNGNQLTSLDLSSCTSLTNLSGSGNQYIITLPGNTFDLTTLPGNFDVTRAGDWVGGTVEGTILTVDAGADIVTYTYDCGNGMSETFTLKIERLIPHNHGGDCVGGAAVFVMPLSGEDIPANGVLPSGSYYLTGNLKLPQGLIIDGEVSICLNGYSITGMDDKRVITVLEGAAFTLYDCAETSGSITGGRGGVLVAGTMTMYGGTITNNHLQNGAVDDTTPEDQKYGGGVYVTGSFTLADGSITGNTAIFCGGGVFVVRDGLFTMNGGTISGNGAESGGGVEVDSAVVNGGFIFNGGSITDNSATVSGGGVRGSMTVSGTPVISGNTVNGAPNNYLLEAGKVITVDDALRTGASIGITSVTAPEKAAPVPVTGQNMADLSSFFFADQTQCRIWDRNHTVMLIKADTYPAVAEGNVLSPGQTVEVGGKKYTADAHGYLWLDNADEKIAAAFTTGVSGTVDPMGVTEHQLYPTSMEVWSMNYNRDTGSYTMEKIDALTNFLTYKGASIRLTGNQGIRIFTAVPETRRAQLIDGTLLDGTALEGYKLKEYGTLFKFGTLSTAEVVYDANITGNRSIAYRQGVDAIFQRQDGDIWFTGMLVNLKLDLCDDELLLRPYMVLENEAGEQVVIHGGTLQRNIGYVAYQNRNYKPNQAAADFIWNIIDAVYGELVKEEAE